MECSKFDYDILFFEVALHLVCVNIVIFMFVVISGHMKIDLKMHFFEEVPLQIAKISGGCAPRPRQQFSIEITTNVDHGQFLNKNSAARTVNFL